MLFVKTFIKNIHIYANISTTPKNTPCIMISLIHLVLTRINDQQSDFKKRALPIYDQVTYMTLKTQIHSTALIVHLITSLINNIYQCIPSIEPLSSRFNWTSV